MNNYYWQSDEYQALIEFIKNYEDNIVYYDK